MTSDGLTCQVERSYEGLDSLMEEWDRAVVELGGTIYMSYHWTRIWWQFYGSGRRLRLFIFRQEGRIVGVVPIYMDLIGFPPFGLRVARIVGAYIPPKVFDPPIKASCAAGVWKEVFQRLFAEDGCDLLSFGPVANDYPAAASVSAVCAQEAALVGHHEIRQRDVQTVYHLPRSYDEYFATLDSKERKTRRKKLRELEAAWMIRAEVVQEATAVRKEFEDFVEQHTQQWESEGRPGHFNAWPNGLEYNRALVNALAPLGRVRFYKLFAGDNVITRQYTYAIGTTLFAELPSRIQGEEWERYSLGCTSQIKLIEAAIQGGVTRIDSGLSHYEYKILTGGKESAVNVIHVMRSGWLSAARFRFWHKIGDLLRLFLHKVWYRNIMPRLPKAFRSGQSDFLLRLDF